MGIAISFQNGLNAVHLAAKEGHVNVVTELLSRGANVDGATKVSFHNDILSLLADILKGQLCSLNTGKTFSLCKSQSKFMYQNKKLFKACDKKVLHNE